MEDVDEVEEDYVVSKPATVMSMISSVLDKPVIPCAYGASLNLNEHYGSDFEVAVVLSNIQCIFFEGTVHMNSPISVIMQMFIILWKTHVLIARFDLPPDPGLLLWLGWHCLGRCGTEEDKGPSIPQDMDLWKSDPDKLPNRGLHLEAAIENPEDSDIIRNNARDDNMVIDLRLNGTENIEGLHQNSSSSISK